MKKNERIPGLKFIREIPKKMFILFEIFKITQLFCKEIYCAKSWKIKDNRD